MVRYSMAQFSTFLVCVYIVKKTELCNYLTGMRSILTCNEVKVVNDSHFFHTIITQQTFGVKNRLFSSVLKLGKEDIT